MVHTVPKISDHYYSTNSGNNTYCLSQTYFLAQNKNAFPKKKSDLSDNSDIWLSMPSLKTH